MRRLGLLQRSKLRYKDMEVSGPAWLVLFVFITAVVIYLYPFDRSPRVASHSSSKEIINKDRCNVNWKEKPLFCSID